MNKIIVIGTIVVTIVIAFLVIWPYTAPQNIQNTTENQIVGDDKDEHGCIPSAGYTWCEAKQKCLRPWEETCE